MKYKFKSNLNFNRFLGISCNIIHLNSITTTVHESYKRQSSYLQRPLQYTMHSTDRIFTGGCANISSTLFNFFQCISKKIVAKIENVFVILGRSCYLLLLFMPSFLLTPLLLTENTSIIWWRFLNTTIRLSGPCKRTY